MTEDEQLRALDSLFEDPLTAPEPPPRMYPDELPPPFVPSKEIIQSGVVDFLAVRSSLELLRQQTITCMLQVETLERHYRRLAGVFNSEIFGRGSTPKQDKKEGST